MIWAALTSMHSVPVKAGQSKECVFKVVRVSGTIRKAEEEAIRQARMLVVAAKSAQNGSKPGTASLLAAPALTMPTSAYEAGDTDMLNVDDGSEGGEASDQS